MYMVKYTNALKMKLDPKSKPLEHLQFMPTRRHDHTVKQVNNT
jgi:hypothetical protein